MSTGIRKLHSKGCPGRDGGRCNCGAGWEASVFSKRDQKKIRKTFANKAEAKTWRDDANTMLAKGGLRAPKPTTVQEAWEAWYEGAQEGTDPQPLGRSLQAVRAARLRGRDATPRAARARGGPARRPDPPRSSGLRRWAPRRWLQSVHDPGHAAPAAGDLPPGAGPRRVGGQSMHGPASSRPSEADANAIASPVEAEALIAAAPERDRAIWATAMYAGLRLGELRALRVGRHRPRRWSDPRRARMGPRGGADRA